jgi:hypothetical protein
MAVNLSFRVADTEITFPIGADAALFELLRPSLPNEVALVSDVREPGEPEAIAGEDLANAADQLLRAIRKGVPGFPAVYYLKDQTGGTIHSGMTCKIQGHNYRFLVGLGRCSMAPNEPPYGAATDLRERDEIQTDEGTFKIVRKTKPTEISKMLRSIRDFAHTHRTAKIIKLLC